MRLTQIAAAAEPEHLSPDLYRRYHGKCPEGYISDGDEGCTKERPLEQKRRERKNRTRPTRLKKGILLSPVREAGNAEDLTSRMEGLLKDFDPKKSEELSKWFNGTFRVRSPKTPPGQKAIKELGDKLIWWLGPGNMYEPKVQQENIQNVWDKLKPQMANLVRYFSDEGGKVVPKEIKSGNITYLNLIGFDEAKLKKYVQQLDALFNSVKGWRKKAFAGQLKVALAGPKHFRGTASGVYKSGEDTLYVRATPKVLKRGEGYGSPQYILIHELGHRYEYKQHPRIDFDRDMWKTTRYSRNEGEAFAELFALGHFGIKKAHIEWDPAIQERFEKAMEQGGNDVPLRERETAFDEAVWTRDSSSSLSQLV